MRARSTEQLADWFLADLTEGVDGTSVRAGVIKLASDERVEPYAAMVLEAAARVSNQTGAPIITHTAAAYRTGEAQADLLESFGVDPTRVTIGHSDDSDDIGYLTGLAARGYRIGMDRLPNGALPNYGGQGIEDRMDMIARAGRAWLRRPGAALARRPGLGRSARPTRTRPAHQRVEPAPARVRQQGHPAGAGAAGTERRDRPRDDRGQPAPVAGRSMTDRLAVQGIPSPLEAHSIPLDNPLHGPPPARFRDGEVLVIEYRTDPEAIATLVPEPLVPVGDTVMVQVARWGDVPGLGRDTHEVNVMVGARYDRPGDPAGSVTGSYSPYFFVDSDRAMAGGREFHGQPKRMAEVGLEVRGDLIVGTLRRNGIDVFTGTLPYKSRAGLDRPGAPAGRLRHEHQPQGHPADRRPARPPPADRPRPDRHRGRPSAGAAPAPRGSSRTPRRRSTGCRCSSSSAATTGAATFSLVGGVVLHEYAEEPTRG